MEKIIRIIVGVLIFGGSVWLATRFKSEPEVGSEVLRKDYAVAYIGADGENDSPVYDSALYVEPPFLLMRDGEYTLNNTCPVRKARLNKRVQPVFVNGLPIGFC